MADPSSWNLVISQSNAEGGDGSLWPYLHASVYKLRKDLALRQYSYAEEGALFSASDLLNVYTVVRPKWGLVASRLICPACFNNYYKVCYEQCNAAIRHINNSRKPHDVATLLQYDIPSTTELPGSVSFPCPYSRSKSPQILPNVLTPRASTIKLLRSRLPSSSLRLRAPILPPGSKTRRTRGRAKTLVPIEKGTLGSARARRRRPSAPSLYLGFRPRVLKPRVVNRGARPSLHP
ncbi:hypothetical protein Acr_00g0033370 [Actinidia rufa]|uniref:Uncharacterized protein n=1 Tax=Actinidia rufa TaxID=165716 RepID=A0A7J0DG50_9ERIC|nr:hypothetical protein Acr_00g0033370 [Actinidia rufa]